MVNSNAYTSQMLRDTKLEVSLGKIAHNLDSIKCMVGSEVSVMAVIKANGYGHRACAVAPTLLEHGADYLAVATLTEAMELKSFNPSWPVLYWGTRRICFSLMRLTKE